VDNLQEKIKSAVSSFISNDVVLLDLDVHEQSASHRIAVYLEPLFVDPKLNIDCEYNKHLDLDDGKTIDLTEFIDIPNYQSCGCKTCEKIIETRNVYRIKKKHFRPDILVHHRGHDDQNEIAIEVKKDHVCPFDITKLKALTLTIQKGGKYAYRLGVYVYFNEYEPCYIWFVDGKELLEGES
jgi:hypothetical protein